MAITEVVERWKTERLKKDVLLHDSDEAIDALVKDLIDFTKQNDCSFAELHAVCDENIRGWVEGEYNRVQGGSSASFR